MRLREARVGALLGAAIARDEQAEILERLGFGVAPADDGLDVSVPHWRRNDVTREADLVEEVGRIWGYEKLPTTLPSRRGVSGRLEPAQRLRRRAEDALIGAGLSEILGWSFAAPVARRAPADPGGRSAPARREAREPDVRGPVRAAHDAARAAARQRAAQPRPRRTRTCGCGSTARSTSRARGVRRRGSGGRGGRRAGRQRPRIPGLDRLPTEEQHLGALLTGRLRPPTWRDPEPPRADFFAAKGVLGRADGRDPRPVGGRAGARAVPAPRPRGDRVLAGGEPAGWLGELHPAVAARWDLEQAAGFELDFGVLARAADVVPRYEDLTSFPAVRQDLAIVVPDGVSAAAVVDVVQAGRRLAAEPRRGVRRLPRRAGGGGLAPRWRCGSSSARPTAR